MQSQCGLPPAREAGGLISSPVTDVRTSHPSRHTRTSNDPCSLRRWAAPAEFLIVNLIPEHDPQSDAELASDRHARFSDALLM